VLALTHLVLWTLNLELLAESFSCELSIGGSFDDWEDFKSNPSWIDLVEFGLLSKVHQSSIIIWRIRWNGGNDTSSLRLIARAREKEGRARSDAIHFV